jgi:hypothetical protein
MGVRPGRRWARGGVGKGDDTAADERTVGEGARTDERRCYGERQADKKISEWGICFFLFMKEMGPLLQSRVPTRVIGWTPAREHYRYIYVLPSQ